MANETVFYDNENEIITIDFVMVFVTQLQEIEKAIKLKAEYFAEKLRLENERE